MEKSLLIKKLLYVIIVSLVGVIAILTVPYMFKKTASNGVVYIGYEELLEKLEGEESFLLIISREDCPDCRVLKEDIEKIIKIPSISIIFLNMKLVMVKMQVQNWKVFFRNLFSFLMSVLFAMVM